MTFRCDGENSHVSEDEAVKIVKGAEVRVRVVGMRIDASEIFCMPRSRRITLGVIGNPEMGEGVQA